MITTTDESTSKCKLQHKGGESSLFSASLSLCQRIAYEMLLSHSLLRRERSTKHVCFVRDEKPIEWGIESFPSQLGARASKSHNNKTYTSVSLCLGTKLNITHWRRLFIYVLKYKTINTSVGQWDQQLQLRQIYGEEVAVCLVRQNKYDESFTSDQTWDKEWEHKVSRSMCCRS